MLVLLLVVAVHVRRRPLWRVRVGMAVGLLHSCYHLGLAVVPVVVMMAGGVGLDHDAHCCSHRGGVIATAAIVAVHHHATGIAIRATVSPAATATAGKVAADGVPGGGADGAQLPRMDLALLLYG